MFGNHDCEKRYVSESSDTESRFAQMSKPAFIAAVQGKYEYCIIYSGECEEGYGNHIVNVRDTHGKLLTTFCNLDCVYNDDEGYSHVITKAQTDFYVNAIETLSKSEGRTVPSIVVTHVPLPQVYTGYNEAKEGKNGSKYFYGEMLETDVKSYKGQSTFFDALVRLGSTKAVFFGHHHSNDLSVEYQGIRLSFIPHSGMSHEYRVKHSREYKLFWPSETVFDFTDVDVYGDHRGGVMVSAGQEGYSFAPIHAAEVIPDYAEWAINYDEVAQAIVQKRGEKHVVRGK